MRFQLIFIGPGGGGFELLFARGVEVLNYFLPGDGEFVHQKNCPGFCPGGWSGLKLSDT